MEIQKFRNMYFSTWEAKKIIEIPVTDAFREGFNILGVSEGKISSLKQERNRLNLDAIIKECAILERLDGGCVLFFDFGDNDYATPPKDNSKIQKLVILPRDTVAINFDYSPNPLKGSKAKLSANGIIVNPERYIIFRGNSPASIGFNGFSDDVFSPSVLLPIYHDIERAREIRQTVFDLTKKASVLIASIDGINAGDSEQIKNIKNILKNMSNEHAAIIDDSSLKIHELSTSFGALPELINTYLKILASALDVPVTRFLGVSNTGLTQSADGDLENYYNFIENLQNTHLSIILTDIFQKIYKSLYGVDEEYDLIEIDFPQLWNTNETEENTISNIKLDRILKTLNAGIMSPSEAIEEINSEHIFQKELTEISDNVTAHQEE